MTYAGRGFALGSRRVQSEVTVVNAKRRILVVDDDASIRSMVRAVLERAGYEVATAHDGCEAITLLAANDYDVVLLDVMMPKLSGVAVVEKLRQENSPVLAHTYLLTAGDLHAVEQLPVRGVIMKPFDIRALIAET